VILGIQTPAKYASNSGLVTSRTLFGIAFATRGAQTKSAAIRPPIFAITLESCLTAPS